MLDYKLHMPETPIEVETPEIVDDSSVAADQQRRGYYYDDACGYEVYDPDEDFDDDETESEATGEQ